MDYEKLMNRKVNTIEHAGVKGMKWGKRKATGSTGKSVKPKMTASQKKKRNMQRKQKAAKFAKKVANKGYKIALAAAVAENIYGMPISSAAKGAARGTAKGVKSRMARQREKPVARPRKDVTEYGLILGR